MKLDKLLIMGSQPRFCRGAETALLLGTSVVGGTIGTMMSNDANKSINKRAQQFSAEEAEKQRKWQSDEWTRQYNIQRDEWYKQLEAYSNQQWQQYLREAEYNSPGNQVHRLAQAGLNPSAVLGGQGSSGLVSAATGNISNVGSPAPPSGGSVSGAAASSPAQIPMQPINALTQFGSVLRDLAAAGKDNALTQPMVELLGQQVIGEKLQNDYRTFENEILSKIKDTKVKQAFADLKLTMAQEAVQNALGKNYDADTLLKKAEEALAVSKKKLSDKEYEVVAFNVEHLLETFTTEINLKKSETAKNRADAGYSVAKTKTEDENRENVVNLTKFQSEWQDTQNKLADIDYKIKAGTYDEQLTLACRKLVEEAKREQLITKRAAAEAEKAIKENDWWLFMNVVSPTIKMVSDKHTEMSNIGVNILKILK